MYQNSGNILLISDDEHELARFRSKFVHHFNVFTVTSIREGHKILSEYDVHVVLVRQKMPEMTGIQFSESISHSFPEPLKIILNNTEDTEALDRATHTGLIYRYVQLPFQDEDLKMTLDGALKLSEAEFKNRALTEQVNHFKAEQENILKLFKKYVPAEVVSQALQSNDDPLIRPGESRVVSVLFADIRGFTDLTSNLKPSQVVEFLNNYWQEISECIKQNKGSVNKYMGDGLLAIFGAPVSYMGNHENAVSAALAMIDALHKINEKYIDLLGKEIKIGIGINSGEVVVGNVGTDNYMEYTVIGDTVNIASRMEAISKKKPNSIIISEHTHNMVHETFETTELKHSTLQGKGQTIAYYEVLGKKPDNVYNIRSKEGFI